MLSVSRLIGYDAEHPVENVLVVIRNAKNVRFE
jgi:hypothetical protein